MATKMSRGYVRIAPELCKGCGLCVKSCPAGALQLGKQLNRHGYHAARYVGEGCSGCGVCFYACPEPGALVVYRVMTGGANRVAVAS